MQGSLFSESQSELDSLKIRLDEAFGKVRHERRLDPTSQFVRAFIGSRTYDEVTSRVFGQLVTRYPNWEAVADASADELAGVLADITFAEPKSVNLKRALRKIRACAGSINLDFLEDLSVVAGLAWLENIYGVGRKIAAATLNFSVLRKRAFVIDTHVLRVLQRFGFVGEGANAVVAYEAMMAAAGNFDANDLYALHWQLKHLGQTSCTYFAALCGHCPLSDICLKRVESAAGANGRLWVVHQRLA